MEPSAFAGDLDSNFTEWCLMELQYSLAAMAQSREHEAVCIFIVNQGLSGK